MFLWYRRDGTPIVGDPAEVARQAAEQIRPENKRVAFYEGRWFVVSTVFLGQDHAFGGSERPVLFETMVFSKSEDEAQENDGSGLPPFDPSEHETRRYCTEDEAVAGHASVVAELVAEEATWEAEQEVLKPDEG